LIVLVEGCGSIGDGARRRAVARGLLRSRSFELIDELHPQMRSELERALVQSHVTRPCRKLLVRRPFGETEVNAAHSADFEGVFSSRRLESVILEEDLRGTVELNSPLPESAEQRRPFEATDANRLREVGLTKVRVTHSSLHVLGLRPA
jgi:hypothetical protein